MPKDILREMMQARYKNLTADVIAKIDRYLSDISQEEAQTYVDFIKRIGLDAKEKKEITDDERIEILKEINNGMNARGRSQNQMAEFLLMPESTVRSWNDRYADRNEMNNDTLSAQPSNSSYLDLNGYVQSLQSAGMTREGAETFAKSHPDLAQNYMSKHPDVERYIQNLTADGKMSREQAEAIAKGNPDLAQNYMSKHPDVEAYVQNLLKEGYAKKREEAEKFAIAHPDLAQNWLSKYQYSSKDDSKVTIVNNAVNENISKMGSSQLTQSLVGDETEKLDKSELPTQEIKKNIDLSDLPEINITEQPHNIEPITSNESTFKPAVEERPTAVKLKGVKKAKSALIQKWKNLSRKQKIAVIVGTAILGTVAIGSAIYAALTGDNSVPAQVSQLDNATVTHMVDQTINSDTGISDIGNRIREVIDSTNISHEGSGLGNNLSETLSDAGVTYDSSVGSTNVADATSHVAEVSLNSEDSVPIALGTATAGVIDPTSVSQMTHDQLVNNTGVLLGTPELANMTQGITDPNKLNEIIAQNIGETTAWVDLQSTPKTM